MNEEPSVEQHLRYLEEKLLQPAMGKSPEKVAALLAAEFIEFGRANRVFDKQ